MSAPKMCRAFTAFFFGKFMCDYWAYVSVFDGWPQQFLWVRALCGTSNAGRLFRFVWNIEVHCFMQHRMQQSSFVYDFFLRMDGLRQVKCALNLGVFDVFYGHRDVNQDRKWLFVPRQSYKWNTTSSVDAVCQCLLLSCLQDIVMHGGSIALNPSNYGALKRRMWAYPWARWC